MAQLFDKNLPKTTTYWTEGQIFFIKTTNFFITAEEGQALADLLIYGMNDKTTKGIVFDNREASGAWPKDISKIWETNTEYTSQLQNKKMATLTDSAIKTMQLNRLSKEHGVSDTSKAFNTEYNDEVKSFILS